MEVMECMLPYERDVFLALLMDDAEQAQRDQQKASGSQPF